MKLEEKLGGIIFSSERELGREDMRSSRGDLGRRKVGEVMRGGSLEMEEPG
jgi:hypothetical protein